MLVEIHRVHPPPHRAAESRVLGIVPENHDIPRHRLHYHTGHFLGRDTPFFAAVANIALQAVGIALAAAVAAGNNPHRTLVAGQRIQIEGDLDARNAFAVVAIGVPPRIADVEIAVAAGVVEVETQSPEWLFGLFGGGTEVFFVELKGYLMVPEVRQALTAIMGFYFGNASAAAKT